MWTWLVTARHALGGKRNAVHERALGYCRGWKLRGGACLRQDLGSENTV